MTRRLIVAFAAAAWLAAGAVPWAAGQRQGAQGRQQQQQQQQQQVQQQQQMQQMTQLLQRMDQIAVRAQTMSRAMGQQMDQARMQSQTREQLQLLQQLCDAVDVQARETRRTMDRLHLMLQDKVMSQDREMQQDMDRLRLHTTQAADGLQEMLNVIERIHKRLGGSWAPGPVTR